MKKIRTEILIGVELGTLVFLTTSIRIDDKFYCGFSSGIPRTKKTFIRRDDTCPIGNKQLITDLAKRIADALKYRRIRSAILRSGIKRDMGSLDRKFCLKPIRSELKIFIDTLEKNLNKRTKVIVST